MQKKISLASKIFFVINVHLNTIVIFEFFIQVHINQAIKNIILNKKSSYVSKYVKF